MATKWKIFSHSLITKIIVFIVVIACFSSCITVFFNFIELNDKDPNIVFQENYYHGREYINKLNNLTETLSELIINYKSKDYISSGKNITQNEIEISEENLYSEFEQNSKSYNPNLSHDENFEIFKEVYADKILQAKNELIKENLNRWDTYFKKLQKYNDANYYVSDGKNELTNTPNQPKSYFKTFPSYLIVDKYEIAVNPKEIENNQYYYKIIDNINQLDPQTQTMYIGFSDDLPKINQWEKDKATAIHNLYVIGGLFAGLLVSFIYLVLIIGRKSFKDKEIQLHFIDKLYNDINIAMCLIIIALWIRTMEFVFYKDFYKAILPITSILGALGLLLVLSLIKHIKNKTFIKHTLFYSIFSKFFGLLKQIYDIGSVGVKIISILAIYTFIVGLTSFIFALCIDDFMPAILISLVLFATIGLGLWITLKKIKEFNAIKEGVKKIKDGDILHTINVLGNGELAKLASNINSITDGLNKAVDNELKSERLKTELISNVSHDIRTPLTSIITYVDLLKNEGLDSKNAQKYLHVLDQKSLRLKTLTDDLFEASKASSGSIPVNLEEIEITSLITQGMGELDDKIASSSLKFKFNYPKNKIFIKADGKLLWRVIENLMSNILKYALRNSRVYIDVIDEENRVHIIFKNISSYELNINANELMERFKRGDESRNTEGSGLGLSIAKSLVELQNGKFKIEIDGDLFKATIILPKQ